MNVNAAHPISRNAWMISRRKGTSHHIHLSVTRIRAAARSICLLVTPQTVMGLQVVSIRAAHWAKIAIQNARHQITEAQPAAATNATHATDPPSQDIWIHRPRVASMNAQRFPVQVHGIQEHHIRHLGWAGTAQEKSGHQSNPRAAPMHGALWKTIATSASLTTTGKPSFQLRSSLILRFVQILSYQATRASFQAASTTVATNTAMGDTKILDEKLLKDLLTECYNFMIYNWIKKIWCLKTYICVIFLYFWIIVECESSFSFHFKVRDEISFK